MCLLIALIRRSRLCRWLLRQIATSRARALACFPILAGVLFVLVLRAYAVMQWRRMVRG